MRAPSRWEDKLHRSGFLIGAVLLHLVAFVCVATWIIFPSAPKEQRQVFHIQPLAAEEKQPDAPTSSADSALAGLEPSVSLYDGGLIQGPGVQPSSIISSQGMGATNFTGPAFTPSHSGAGQPMIHGIPQDRLKLISDHMKYATPRQIHDRTPAPEFPVYVAKYAQGDWSCNLRLDKEGNIVAGSMPDLLAKINEWSHGRIHGTLMPKPLNIASRELLDRMPPFIFLTGHRDFKFTDEEIANLRDYLQAGGAIWADNALAGYGSPFDVAFRREMKRLAPEHPLEPLGMSSEIFAAGPYRFAAVPSGINFRAEPIEHLDIDGVMAVIYTPNDYSDLYQMRILPGDKSIQIGRIDPNRPDAMLTTNWLFYSQRKVYFRNFELPAALAVHRLGMDVVNYLLVRWYDKVELTP